MAKLERIEIENVLQPGKTYRVEAAKFAAMRDAMLGVLPAAAPGLTPGEIKAVQLDQEAKGVIARSTAPVRLYRA